MTAPETVSLDAATQSESMLLSNLLELYIHDLSDVFLQVELGTDGRYGYEQLPQYWSDPERRFPFLIRCDGHVAGFVLAKRGSSASSDPDVFDVAEFFVMRRYRRSGVGRRAAFLLWDRLPGTWTVRVGQNNRRALEFWRSVVAEYTNGSVSEATPHPERAGWRVFQFDNTARPATA